VPRLRRLPHRTDAGHDRQDRGRGGQTVAEGDLVVVLEAMKMEQPITAHKAGVVTGLSAEVGATVSNGAVLCEIKDVPPSAMPLTMTAGTLALLSPWRRVL
jgi:hypothetical protein